MFELNSSVLNNFLSVDANLSAAVSSIISKNASDNSNLSSSLTTADASLSSAISVQSSIRLSADASLSSAISVQSSIRLSVDNSLSSGLSSESAVRLSVDNSLSVALSSGSAVRLSVDNSLSSGLSSELAVRLSVDNSLSLALSSGSAVRLSVDSSLSVGISSESVNRINADNSLASELMAFVGQMYTQDNSLSVGIAVGIANLSVSLSNVIGGAPEMLNSLNELADAIGSDVSFASRIETANSSLSIALSSELADRLSVDNSLSVALSSESADRLSVDNSLSVALSSESSLRFTGDSNLSVALSSESSSRVSIDSSLSVALSSESSERVSLDSSVSVALSSDSAVRVSVDNSLSVALSSESSERVSLDSSLSVALSSETSERVSLDSSLSVTLSSESSLRFTGDSNLSVALSSETAARLGVDNSLSVALSSDSAALLSINTSLSNGMSLKVTMGEINLKTHISDIDGSGILQLLINSNTINYVTNDLIVSSPAFSSMPVVVNKVFDIIQDADMLYVAGNFVGMTNSVIRAFDMSESTVLWTYSIGAVLTNCNLQKVSNEIYIGGTLTDNTVFMRKMDNIINGTSSNTSNIGGLVGSKLSDMQFDSNKIYVSGEFDVNGRFGVVNGKVGIYDLDSSRPGWVFYDLTSFTNLTSVNALSINNGYIYIGGTSGTYTTSLLDSPPSWSQILPATEVTALYVDSGHLYMGVKNTVNSVTSYSLQKYNLNDFNVSVLGKTDNKINEIKINNGIVCIGGDFMTADSTDATRSAPFIAFYSNDIWTTPMVNLTGSIRSIAFTSTSSAYTGGDSGLWKLNMFTSGVKVNNKSNYTITPFSTTNINVTGGGAIYSHTMNIIS